MEAKFHVPSTYNDGQPVPNEVLNQVWDEALARFGGFSRSREPNVEGAWTNDSGAVFHDHNYTLVVAILKPEDKQVAVDLARWMANLLKQESIYLVFMESDVRFIEP